MTDAALNAAAEEPTDEPQATLARSVSSRRAVADVGAQIGGQVVNLALGIVATIVLVRALGSTRYGEWATILALIELVGLVGNFGVETVAVRFAAQDPERAGSWVGAATSLRVLVSLPVLAIFLVVIAVIAGSDEMLVAGLVLSVLYLTAALSTLRIVFRLHVRNHITAGFAIANSVLWTGLIVAIAAFGGGLVPFALAFAGTAVVIQGATAIVALRTMEVRWRGVRHLWPRLFRVGLAVGIAGTLTFAYARIDQLLIYELAPKASEVGVYAAMCKILENAGFVPIAVMTTLFPIMAGLYPGEPERLRRIMQAAIDYLAMISLGALALTVAAAGPIVELLFGPSYAEGATILPILFAAFIPICIGNVAGNMVIATDLQRRYIWFAAIGLLINAPLNLLLIPSYGIEASAWITLATEVAVVSLTLAAVLRRIEMRLAPGRIVLATLAAAVAGLGVWGLRQAGLGAIPLIAAMTLAYPALLIALRALDLGELRTLIRRRRVPEAAA
ncbi:MAG TPA: flippase [Solirubrobacterales bacterium]|nr:flippase [Solirubrobacterales bacterium]